MAERRHVASLSERNRSIGDTIASRARWRIGPGVATPCSAIVEAPHAGRSAVALHRVRGPVRPRSNLVAVVDDERTIGYAAAMAELETILDELERDTVDVDRLGSQVRRAAELIKLCRDRVGAARLDVERVVTELGSEAG